MKNKVQALIVQAIKTLQETGELNKDISIDVRIERTRDKQHGDFACNIAMSLAKSARCKPRDLAEKIVAALPQSGDITKIDIAGPGFINFFISATAYHKVILQVLEAEDAYGHSSIGDGRLVQVEFVSANPTGPLHVGHGRGAAYGATVADLLTAAGFKVHREYYVNDAGRQMDILTTSVWLRYLELCNEEIVFPANGYRGQYVIAIAQQLLDSDGKKYCHSANAVMDQLPADSTEGGDKEAHIDALILAAKQFLGDSYRTIFNAALDNILGDIRQDLEEFGVVYEQWYSEHSLVSSGAVTRAIERLRDGDHLYESNGAWWFRSTSFGDEKDRVVIRENGQTTYFASDIAYHMEKLERGYDRVIDVWGADHHGYVPRVKAALDALGDDSSRLEVLLVQFANLYRGKEKVQMSTRSGEFVTLRELRKEVGNDAARFFYVMRKCEQHMDFDLELAKSQSSDNPVYYVQYAHARICSVLKQMDDKELRWNRQLAIDSLELLVEQHELDLVNRISRFPEIVESAAIHYEPHQLTYYLRELANDFHTYYNAHQFLTDDEAHRNARIALIIATRQVIRNGLGIIGVSAPTSM